MVKERQTLSNALANYMSQLGLAKVGPEPEDLTSYLEKQYGNGGEANSHHE